MPTRHVAFLDEVPAPLRTAAGTGFAPATFVVESDEQWLVSASKLGTARVRLLGGMAGGDTGNAGHTSHSDATTALAFATGGSPDIAVYSGAVTEAGRVELLPFLQEQAISITAHRFGTPNHLSDGVN